MRAMSKDNFGGPTRWLALCAAAFALTACHNEPKGDNTQPPPPAQYSVSVTVSGLNGSGLVLTNNGAGNLSVTANGSVAFTATQLSGTAYAVAVAAQPASPDQTCSVSNGSGTIGSADVTNVTVTCVNNYVPTYTPAPQGDPVGAATTQVIDATGGSATSPDGRLNVTIPAGALASATTISIQPITNTAPNGLGNAYRLEPEGTTFAAPVTLALSLSASESLGIDSTFVATQHADGLWYSQPNQVRDSVARTITVSTTHFSSWTGINTVVLTPDSAPRVRTGGFLGLTASIVMVDPSGNPLVSPTTELAIPGGMDLSKSDAPRRWSVEDVVGGNTTVGQISDPGAYWAPATVPTPNPVTVKVEAQLDTSRAIAVQPVTIFAQELWGGTTDITQIDGTKIHADVTFVSKSNSVFTFPTRVDFQVLSGQVRVTIPATNAAGCTQSVDVPTHSIATNDGSLSVTYDTDAASGQAVGGGTTVWGVMMTVVCSNGTQVVQTSQAAPWWPVNATNPLQSFPATNGVIDATVGDLSATGNVHLVRQ